MTSIPAGPAGPAPFHPQLKEDRAMKRWQQHPVRRYEYERAKLQLAKLLLFVLMSLVAGFIVRLSAGV